MIRYHNFPPEHPLPVTDAQARAMGCTIFRGYLINPVTQQLISTTTYWYQYKPCVRIRQRQVMQPSDDEP